MGLNAQTAVPEFQALEVLTAAEMTQVNTGIPVFATTTTRDAAFGGAGEKTLAQGQTCYIEATSQYQTYSGSSWINMTPGLVFLSTTTIGSGVSTVSLPANTFTSAFANYRILFTFPASVTGSAQLTINTKLRAGGTDDSSAAYSWNGFTSAGSLTNNVASNQTSFLTVYVRNGFEERSFGSMEVYNPQLATETNITVNSWSDFGGTFYNLFENGMLNTTTVYDSLSFVISGGTLTGGKISVYGYNL
jgi:hypothetical protein